MDRLADTAHENERIVLGLLNSVAHDGGKSQRHIAAELGIALGLVNAYLKRSIKKGLVKVSQAPARRYAYYLTPKGFSEKSRLTVEYLSLSFSFFRQAKFDCMRLFDVAKAQGLRRIVLSGKSDLSDIAILCAVESGITIVALVDAFTDQSKLIGVPVVPSFETIEGPFDAVIVTDVAHSREAFDDAVRRVGRARVLVPTLLGLPVDGSDGAVA
ncbi:MULTISPECIES: winged helix-turn-helix transcriptional regulator [unclassified Bradyrhizobium]|uniref:winged helix-turn-helix transcriptional regulator n=1 Tax=unclassified Bradyrhizobium TaxID=2631580 RepID=UPI002FF1AA48